MSATVESVALKPMQVLGHAVTTQQLIDVALGVANAPHAFIAMDLVGPLPAHGWQWKQEVANRLLQRWRKLGLVRFGQGKWTMGSREWDALQSAVRYARATPTDLPPLQDTGEEPTHE